MIIDSLVVGFVAFSRNVVGIVTRPYETYRRITEHGSLWELIYVGVFLAFYFALASLVKTATFRPFLLTKEFVILSSASVLTYCFIVLMLWGIGMFVGAKGSLRALFIGWGYTLIPTSMWFLVTSILYVLLPPPRTESTAGIAFSILFLVFSTALFFWKFILAYLTMRFGLHLDLVRILAVVGICLPILAIYSMLMYRLGIFRIPFI